MRVRVYLASVIAIVLLSGVTLWLFTHPASRDTVIAPLPQSPVTPVQNSTLELPADAATAMEQLSRQLASAKEKQPTHSELICDMLMRAAELAREIGRDTDARVHYEEIRSVCELSVHWQTREAIRKLMDLETETARPKADRVMLRQARELHRTASDMYHRGQYTPAIPICERSLSIRKSLHSNPHHELADSLCLLGKLQANRGDQYEKAYDTLLEARHLYRKTFGEDHPTYAICLHWLGTLEDDRGAFVEAQDLFTKAMEIFRATRGEFSSEYANTLARLGRMHAGWSVTGAEAKILRAMHIRETTLGTTHPDYAESLHDLGVLAFQWLHLERAKDLFLRAKQVRAAALGSDHPLSAESLSWLGRALVDEVDLTVGHEYHRQAIALAELAHGPDHPLVARYLSNFANMCHQENDFDRGDQLFARSLAIRNRLGLARHPEHANILRCRAMNLNEWAFGVVYWENRDVNLQPVEQLYDEVLRLYESIPNSDRLPEYAGALLEFAEVYYVDEYKRRTQTECRKLIAKAKAMMELGGALDSHPFYLTYLTANSYAATSEGNYAESKQHLDRAVQYSQGRFGFAFPYKRMIGSMLRVGLRLHAGVQLGNLDPEVIQDFQAVLEADRAFSQRATNSVNSSARLGIARSFSESTNALLSLVLRFGASFDSYQKVLEYRGLVTSLQAVDQAAYDRPELIPLLERLRNARRDLTRVVYSAPAQTEERARWLDEVYRLSGLKDDLEGEIAFRVRGLPTEQEIAVYSVKDVQASLPENSVLVEYVGFQLMESPPTGQGRIRRVSSMVAFVIKKSGEPILVPLGPREEIELAVERWRNALISSRNTQSNSLETASNDLADRIWKPIAKHIGAVDRLILAPDGPIASVSFAALPGNRPGRYLLEDYRIHYVPAGRVLAAQHSNPNKLGSGLLVMGDMDFSSAGRTAHPVLRGWPKLPFTKMEINNVSERFAFTSPSSTIEKLTGTEATATRFAATVHSKPRFIHFAGHGFFAQPQSFPDLSGGPAGRSGLFRRGRTGHPALLRNQQLLSGLVMAPGEHQADQLFTAEQVSSQDFRATELVVLSACETGVGDLTVTEGAMSLQRAFLTAGARSVMASLWKVDDAATAVLMEEFYRNLWKKKLSKVDALREAQLALLRRPESVQLRARELRGLDTATPRDLPITETSTAGRTNPALWAAFTLTGDGR